MSENQELREALAKLVKASRYFRNTVVETRGVRGMDEHDVAITEAEAVLRKEADER